MNHPSEPQRPLSLTGDPYLGWGLDRRPTEEEAAQVMLMRTGLADLTVENMEFEARVSYWAHIPE